MHVRSPSKSKSTAARKLRPMRRRISCVLPRKPFVSLGVRVCVDLGSMPYSAVIQPPCFPESRIHFGIFSSMLALQSTRVLPMEKSTDPSGYST